MKRQYVGLALLLGIVCLVFIFSRLGFVPKLDDLAQSRMVLEQSVAAHTLLAPLLFVVMYVVVVALSLPLATPLTLLGGFLFGAVLGMVLVVVGATVGAGVVFLLARYFFRDFFMERVRRWRGGEDTPPAFGTFTDVLVARLIPAIPFSLINIVAGLTNVSFRDYLIATAIGIAPFTAVYVYAGTTLGDIHSTADILNAHTLRSVSLLLLAGGVLYVAIRIYAARVKTEKRSTPN